MLATLFVPELVEDFGTKKATVKLDEERVELARKLVEVADADVKAAEARLDEAKAILDKYQAEVDRWDSEVKRLKHEVKRGVVDPQILLESTNQWKSSIAARDAAKATIDEGGGGAALQRGHAREGQGRRRGRPGRPGRGHERGEADRGVGRLPHAHRPLRRRRSSPATPTPATSSCPPPATPRRCTRSPYLSPGGNAAPIYVVDRTDIVRIFVDIPEQDANYVHIGTKATVLARAYRDEPIPGTVTRTSWALNVKSRTLRAEIDLPNPGSQLLPGMYAYAKVIIERPGVRALPVAALTHSGEKTFCWTYKDGHAVRTEVRTGVSDGDWIEVTNLQRPTSSSVDDPWAPVNGSEQVILGDLSILADGGPVEVVPAPQATKVAAEPPPAGDRPAETAGPPGTGPLNRPATAGPAPPAGEPADAAARRCRRRLDRRNGKIRVDPRIEIESGQPSRSDKSR